MKKTVDKERRIKKVRLRKNFFLTLILIVILWLFIIFEILFIDPESFGIIPLFLISVFLALLFTFSTILVNTRMGTLISFGLTFFLVLRYFGLGNIINLILIAGLVIATEIYFSRK